MALRSTYDQVYIGLLTGILFPFIGMIIFYQYHFDTLTLMEFFQQIQRLNKLPQVISIGVITNLAAFYLFLWKKFYYGARGVLAATFLWVLIVVILKYFV